MSLNNQGTLGAHDPDMTKQPQQAPCRAACMFAGGLGTSGTTGVSAGAGVGAGSVPGPVRENPSSSSCWGGAGGADGVALPVEPPVRERKLLRTCRRRVGGPVSKHTGQKEKPVHLVQRRNARERRRVQAVNVAFSRLSKVVPLETRGKRISKVKTLHKAIEYIDQLRRLLAADDLSRGHVTGPAPLESGGDKENAWCAPLQVYADDFYQPPQQHVYNMQYTIMTGFTPDQ
ncbi:Protein atonal 7 [Amphibalanus amphitrite]|uniref:Protein atonal 7 n=1 Tax=Amphibalanus amphitrite TaxID=1232801 RepID=A0A6A4VDH0_AMPAM|nr:Protein atonal 7 [Amphibalanus amphitrite]